MARDTLNNNESHMKSARAHVEDSLQLNRPKICVFINFSIIHDLSVFGDSYFYGECHVLYFIARFIPIFQKDILDILRIHKIPRLE